MAPPLATTADLPSSSTTRAVRVSDTPLSDLAKSGNFITRQVPVPFDDAAFTNAALLEYTDSLGEPIDISVGQTFKDKSRCQYVLSQFAIRNKFQYKVLYSNFSRFSVVCFEDKCNWRVDAIHAWLTEIGYERWASSHFTGKRFNLVTTNISECVNALFKEAREYPVTKLIEAVRCKIQELFYKRRESAASFVGPLTPWAEQQLKDLIQKARDVRCHPISRDEYHVVGNYNDTVKLSSLSCTCREFDMKGYPCLHALSSCINYNLSHYSYCSPFYTVQNYLSTYNESVYPVRDMSEWEIIDGFKEYCAKIKPPGQKRPSGRPKKLRIPSRGEESKTLKCGRCNQSGHNRRTCKFPIPDV
ncbi:uncharacterized protein LOC131244031 [Magnolia sinica]|uniref:uncharacterized protein LOC131244031 n=1 Tax=Magnolia sinica TaxID=86752 RepID=UPI002658422B|nr:uncharacterized protein LOC131244031 [Magnolia sinica]